MPATVIVLDFETTGMSPTRGSRPIELGAVRLQGDRITDRFQSLMHPGMRINPFITELTGISNEMVAEAPPCAEVIGRFADWIGDAPLVAHNARFDIAFLDAELARLGRRRNNPFACTVLAARRIVPEAPNHRLATLATWLELEHNGVFHRALADAELTAALWLALIGRLRARYSLTAVPFTLMQQLTLMSRSRSFSSALFPHQAAFKSPSW
ncbi:MAG: PolC-type DNA polymerase III [Desulfobulbus sp.]|jgi:DNA polymerase-3 subunit epsilon